ncbi:hypothetical protein DsansV1_C16g0142841 [Dioscorea sansibarensis]
MQFIESCQLIKQNITPDTNHKFASKDASVCEPHLPPTDKQSDMKSLVIQYKDTMQLILRL